MATIVDLANSFDSTNAEYDVFLHDLLNFGSDLPFHTDEVNSIQSLVVSAINSRTNQANTRCSGLRLLDQILPRCTKDLLSKYGVLWITKATQVVENSNSSVQELTLACKVIGCLISQCKDIPELQKQISMQSVKQLLNAIANLKAQHLCGAGYYLVANLLFYYPEACERLQSAVRKMLLLQIDETNEQLVKGSAKCYALLAKATERSFKPPNAKSFYTSWTYSQAVICNSLHLIMDEIFTDLIELENTDAWYTLDLPAISNENIVEYYSKQRQRFSNLCVYLCTMLRGCSSINMVLPNDILKILCRGLAITPRNLKKRNSFKEQILYLILPTLHINLLNVLEALISGFKQELVPYGSKILQLFQQTLEWTGNAIDDQSTLSGSKPFKTVRINVYKCLSSWLIYTGALSGVETLAQEYLPLILKDVIPERNRVLLTVQKTQHLSKRALKRLRDNQYEKASSGGTEPASKNLCLDADLCKEALIVLENIFFSRSCWLKKSFYKNVQNVVIPLLYDFYLGSTEQNFYNQSSECRFLLLKTLKALQLNPHYSTPAPLQYSVELFEMALNDSELIIINEAKLTLAELEKIAHPGAQTLRLPIQETIDNDPDTAAKDLQTNEIENHENTSLLTKRQKISSDEEDTFSPVEVSEVSKIQEDKNFENICPSQDENETISKTAEQEIKKLADLSLEKDETSYTRDTSEVSQLNTSLNTPTQDVEMTMDTNSSEKTHDAPQEDNHSDDVDNDNMMHLFHDEPKDL